MPTAVLLIWPLVAMGLFAAIGPVRGLIWATGIGYLFLPEFIAFTLPGFPPYDKRVAITFGLLLGIMVAAGQDKSRPVIEDKTFRITITVLLVLLFAGNLGTILVNDYPLMRSGRFQPALVPRDVVRLSTEILVTLTPFLLARRWLSDPKFHTELLKALVILGVIYSFLVLFEARMSPQLNRWVYDFFPHSWRQHIRGGGYRPIVFLSHGLSVGFFLFTSAIAAMALSRQPDGKARMIFLMIGIWLLLALIVSRNFGATLMAFMFIPVIVMLGRKWQIRMAVGIALFFMVYPIARTNLPTDSLVATVSSYSAERAESLEFRLKHEDELVARALEKPLFGWGGWGRSRLVDDRGNDISVTDGGWIIQLGKFGWFGYLGYFGLAALPIFFLRRRPEAPFATIGLAMITAGALFYTIPNSEMRPLVWLISGALAGFIQYGPRRSAQDGSDIEAETSNAHRVRYSRFEPEGRKAAATPYSRDLGAQGDLRRRLESEGREAAVKSYNRDLGTRGD